MGLWGGMLRQGHRSLTQVRSSLPSARSLALRPALRIDVALPSAMRLAFPTFCSDHLDPVPDLARGFVVLLEHRQPHANLDICHI